MLADIAPKNKPNVRAYLEYVESVASKNGIFIDAKIRKKQYLRCNHVNIGGYFDSEERVLATARYPGMHLTSWLMILVHEASHMHQFLHCPKMWDSVQIGNVDVVGAFDAWLVGAIELRKDVRTRYVRKIINFERDCEIRAVGAIEKFNLPIDVGHYSQAANEYLLSYRVMLRDRKWYSKGKEPYDYDRMKESLPGRIMTMRQIMAYDGFDQFTNDK